MTITGVIYSRGSANGANTVRAYNRFSYINTGTIDAELQSQFLNSPQLINLSASAVTEANTGEWVDVNDQAGKYQTAAYYLNGSGSGFTSSLQYRPNSSSSYMTVASYTGINSEVIQEFDILDGQYRHVGTSGTGLGYTPQILIQKKY